MNEFDQAIEQALKSSFRQRMGAVVVRRGKVVGKGFNYAHSTGEPYGDGMHAEISALNNTTARYRKDSTVYVCRINGSNSHLRLAKPCINCQKIMKKLGVRYVWYSTEEGDWNKMEL